MSVPDAIASPDAFAPPTLRHPHMLPFQQTEPGCRVEACHRGEVRVGADTVGLQWHRPRALPWLRVVKAPRFGRGLTENPDRVIAALVEKAMDEPVLRLEVHVWNEQETVRAEIGRSLRRAGFMEADPHQSYRHTIWIDLSPSEDELLASFHATCRRHIRAPEKRGYHTAALRDAGYASRMRELIAESFRRHDGTPPALDWSEILRQADRPEPMVRIEGLFADPSHAPDTLVSFAVAYLHGEVAEYAHAGSTRCADGTPLLYAPTWNLIRWARRRGARAWDFGGISDPRRAPALEGIRTFKEYFSHNALRVGEEWTLTLRPFWSRVQSTVSGLKSLAPPARRASG
ncbi:MAG: hypothetical protein WD031_03820 [Gemmatimonadota bacterium]